MVGIRKYFSGQLLISLRNVGWMFFDRIFRMATGLIVGVWLARYLGPEQYGLLNYVYVFPLVLSALVSLGLNTLLVSEIPTAASREEIDKILITSVFLKITTGLISFFLILVANYYIHQSSPLILKLVIISSASLLFQGFDVVDTYFQSIRRVHYSIFPKVFAFLLATVARLYGLTQGYDLYFFVSVSIIELATGYIIIFLLYFLQRKLPDHPISFHKVTAHRLLKAAWPIMLAEFFIFIYMRLDQLMIKHLATSSELGKYSAALRISESWYFVAGALTASFYPGIIALRSTDYAAYLRRYQSLLNLLTVIGLIIGIVFTLFAEPITHLLYGDRYAGVGTILSIHIWTGLFIFLGVGSNNWFVVENLQKLLLGRTIAGAILNALLNLILIPSNGAVGASIATLIAQLCASYLSNGFLSKTAEVFQMQTSAITFVPRQLTSYIRKMLIRIESLL